ncbi:hypothetical protein QVD17_03247 [Tagetes erecta]|uniref:Uncharacterized protein n=1 Tax=Tagetes erecta TaxID=13708 RepID=A0AAD8KNA5_TARER|nr:hypothetical protein QVD17_14704 [Tagetes erecta]KAK1437456.1 hypothetical protein QVD17_03247 [Tagetes erecta]
MVKEELMKKVEIGKGEIDQVVRLTLPDEEITGRIDFPSPLALFEQSESIDREGDEDLVESKDVGGGFG